MKILHTQLTHKLDNIKSIINNNIKNDKSISFYNSPIEINYRIKDCKKTVKKTLKNKSIPADIIGFRIITKDNNITILYNILRNIELNYIVVPNTFKDYITNKKNNDYQSLHICITIDHIPLEILRWITLLIMVNLLIIIKLV